MGFKSGWSLLLATLATAQIVQPSNNTGDISDASSSPRFFMNATGPVKFPGFLIAPLGSYAWISRNDFLDISFGGILVNTDASNANQVTANDFNLVSCDPEDYDGGNIDATSILRIITNQQPTQNRDTSSLIFYSTRSSHCNVTGMRGLPPINGVFTTLDPTVVAEVVQRNFTSTSTATVSLTPDKSAYTNTPQGTPNNFSQAPTTAIAMIILYSITGIITALFVIIIITGAVRAHRHPERYGPRRVPGQTRQSRAKGIARAMLETLPIVKFGDHHDLPDPKAVRTHDIEMANGDTSIVAETSKVGDKSVATSTAKTVDSANDSIVLKSTSVNEGASNADGTDEAGSLGCSICTEDFQKGEEVRVLPCNHKFHPDCVDPWLLNVSGTCPLCRISLTPEGEEPTEADGTIAPPLATGSPFTDRRSQAISNLMAIAYGSREERVTALRRYRNERRNRSTTQENDENRISRTRAFREAFRIRTRRHEPTEAETEMRNSGLAAISGPQVRF